MPGALPDGEPVPPSGQLPASAGVGAGDRDLGAYVHVPFCRVRCGYCDFNTYTATELRGVSQATYRDEVAVEIALAAEVLGAVDAVRPLATVFFGGGTPTLLPARDLVGMLDGLREAFGLRDGAEVTVEANPDSVTPDSLRELAAGGVTRASIGMQSAVPKVLATLDRTHDPANVPAAVAAAKGAGLAVSVDLIYGTPGESMADWRTSLEAALALEPDHVSAYSLIVEDGTQMARKIRRGELPDIDPDVQADMYELADELLGGAGFEWYEVSNWSRGGAHPSRHNLSYWLDADWWGFGPGAHSHVGGVRWWNAKHPAAYAQRLHDGETPAVGREVLDADTKRLERVMLGVRLREGLDAGELADRTPVAGLIADGLVDARAALAGRIVPTLRGRLLGDAVARRLT